MTQQIHTCTYHKADKAINGNTVADKAKRITPPKEKKGRVVGDTKCLAPFPFDFIKGSTAYSLPLFPVFLPVLAGMCPSLVLASCFLAFLYHIHRRS